MLKLISRTRPQIVTTRRFVSTSFAKYPFLKELDLQEENSGVFNGSWRKGLGASFPSINPTTNEVIAITHGASTEQFEETIKNMTEAQQEWQKVPGPKRGEIVRQIGDAFREKLKPLGSLVSLEMGKSLSEGIGEVQEFIDVCDFATGLSRSLNGQIWMSERPDHQLMEMWNPVGNVGVITAFNFPVAVYGWNAALSLVVGNANLHKGSHTTPLCSIAVAKIMEKVFRSNGFNPALSSSLIGDGVGQMIVDDHRISLVSFTGSTAVGRQVGEKVAKRFGRSILELGGNNAVVVMDDANLDLALRAVLFGAVGTAGQRCTTTRRLLVHEKIYSTFVGRLVDSYKKIKSGDPSDPSVLLGPLHTQQAVTDHLNGIKKAVEHGGKVLVGGKKIENGLGGNFVEPTVIEAQHDNPQMQHEVFSPILYVVKFKDLTEAIQINNSVPQGLSSSIFTNNQLNLFQWVGPTGSDCGIANVNTGTSGAEIGGAFGGNKETGGGRESGSDSWKQYARRTTITINHGTQMPLAQGVTFG
jgi:aldehyde dehydrogenase family 7 protein A1